MADTVNVSTTKTDLSRGSIPKTARISLNPLNDYMIPLSVKRATDRQLSPRIIQWAETVWLKWLRRQPECVIEVEVKLGPTARARRVNSIDDWNDITQTLRGSTFAGGVFRQRLQAIAERQALMNIPLDTVFDNMMKNPDVYTYEVEVYPMLWCHMYAPWQWRWLAEHRTFQWWVADGREQLRELFDWMRACPEQLPADMSRMSVEQAQRMCTVWHDRMERRKAEKAADPGYRIEVMPGIHRLKDAQALWYEGNTMHHCVGSYWQDVEDNTSMIFHIDDPRCTVEVRGGYIEQVRGVCNEPIELPQDIQIRIMNYCMQDKNESHAT